MDVFETQKRPLTSISRIDVKRVQAVFDTSATFMSMTQSCFATKIVVSHVITTGFGAEQAFARAC